MNKLRNFLCYSVAAAMFFFLMSVFMFRPAYTQLMMRLPFMKVDPKFSGGQIVDTICLPDHRLYIHESVFPALFGESDEGFVQIDVVGNIDAIVDTVDYNNDGKNDFILKMSDMQFDAISIDSNPYNAYISCTTDSGFIVRVGMKNYR